MSSCCHITVTHRQPFLGPLIGVSELLFCFENGQYFMLITTSFLCMSLFEKLALNVFEITFPTPSQLFVFNSKNIFLHNCCFSWLIPEYKSSKAKYIPKTTFQLGYVSLCVCANVERKSHTKRVWTIVAHQKKLFSFFSESYAPNTNRIFNNFSDHCTLWLHYIRNNQGDECWTNRLNMVPNS